MERMTLERVNGIKTGYWSPKTKEEVVQRLAAYENTGLTPEEVAAWNELGGYVVIGEDKKIMPGTAVFQHDNERVYESHVLRIIYETDAGFAFGHHAIGYQVFLTREMAEASMRRSQS